MEDNVEKAEEHVGAELAEWDHLVANNYLTQFEIEQMEFLLQ